MDDRSYLEVVGVAKLGILVLSLLSPSGGGGAGRVSLEPLAFGTALGYSPIERDRRSISDPGSWLPSIHGVRMEIFFFLSKKKKNGNI